MAAPVSAAPPRAGNQRTFSMSSRLPRLSRGGSMIRGVVDHGTTLLPFASYPVMLPVRSKKIVPTFFVAAIVIYCALTVWNVLTQGYNLVLVPRMQTTFENHGGTSCQPVQMNVGQTLYTKGSGVFNWAITGVAANDTTSQIDSAFAYQGGDMQCNITSMGVTYYFAQLNFVYGVCANCSVPTTSAVSWDASATESHELSSDPTTRSLVTMCSNWDQALSQPAAWAYQGQHDVQNKIYSMGPFYQNLTFPNGTFPVWQFPPYGVAGQPVPTNTATQAADAQDVAVWMAGIRYMPDLLDQNGYNGNATLNGANHKVVTMDTGEVSDIWSAYNYSAAVNYLSGTTLAFNGLGGLALGGPKPATWTPPEPLVITNMRQQGVSVMNFIMDRALDDVHQSEIVADYLCTVQDKRWKGFWSMLAMVLGNNAALFSLFLFAAPKLARMWDQREFGETVLPFVDAHMAGRHSRQGSTAGGRSRDPTVVDSPRGSINLEKGSPPRDMPGLPHYQSYNSTMEQQEIFADGRAPHTMSPAQIRRGTLDDRDEMMDITAANTPASSSNVHGSGSTGGGGRPLPPPMPMRQDSSGMPVQSPLSAGVTSPSAALMGDGSGARSGRGAWGPRPVS